MDPIPFAALPPAERQAVMDALQRSGVPLRQVCVSMTPPIASETGWRGTAVVTAPGWCRSYEADAGWIARLESDLAVLRDGS